jgi:1-deoxy-D-xylulose-5-phosphate reductoisomerase
MKKKISILGSTGSIGTQTLEVVRLLGLEVVALAAHRNIKMLEDQVREFRPRVVAVYDDAAAAELRVRCADLPVAVYSGIDGLCAAAAVEEAEIVLNAVVGMVGLRPTLSAIEAGKDIALANKETMVAGGALVAGLAKEKGVAIYPVDSEHSAIFQCLQGCPEKGALERVILTASGGPFFGYEKDALAAVTPEQALNHPNWSMGPKITVDCATMMNKGLEVIEAIWLFDLQPSQVDVVIHRESIVHSMVEFRDHSVIAQLGLPDMRIPIQYALTYPERVPSAVGRLDLADIGKLSFYRPDDVAFPCLGACRQAIERGGLCPAAANGANEEAVSLFLKGKISFLRIGELVMAAVARQHANEANTLDRILQADLAAREFVRGEYRCNG